MGKFVNIRNKLKDVQQHSDLCYGCVRELLRSYKSKIFPYCSENDIRSIICAIATLIFAAIHNKSLKKYKKLEIISFVQPKNIETLNSGPYYRQIGVDKYEGPYWCSSTNQYKLDVTYYQWSAIYEVSLQEIFRCKNEELIKVHEYIGYNAWKWGHKFITHWKSLCHPILSNIQFGWIIFVDGKYLLISWLPKGIERWSFRGYESYVAICGGKEIDVKYEYQLFLLTDPKSKLCFVHNDMWYVSKGEQYDIVSNSSSNIVRLCAIKSHQNMISERKLAEQTLLWEQELQETKQKNAVYRLDLGLKQINRELKLTKYGSKYHFGYTAGVDVWFDYLLTELPKVAQYTHRWTMLLSEANMIFSYNNAAYFQRNFRNIQKDIIYLNGMNFSMSSKSGIIKIDAILLKRNDDGLIDGTNHRSFKKDYYSLDTVINDSIFYNILEFTDCKDIKSFQRVSQKCFVLGTLKLNGLNHIKFLSTLFNA
eukprot:117402_1